MISRQQVVDVGDCPPVAHIDSREIFYAVRNNLPFQFRGGGHMVVTCCELLVTPVLVTVFDFDAMFEIQVWNAWSGTGETP